MSIMTGPLIDSYDITNKAIDLEEMQGTPEAIALKKVKLASQTIQGPAMTEDVSLCFNALGGMPGPYIKDFLDNAGREGLYKMLLGFTYQSKQRMAEGPKNAGALRIYGVTGFLDAK